MFVTIRIEDAKPGMRVRFNRGVRSGEYELLKTKRDSYGLDCLWKASDGSHFWHGFHNGANVVAVIEGVDRQLEAEARAEYEASRTEAVLIGLEMVRKNGGSMAALPAPGPGYGPQPSKIAHLVAFATIRGSHSVQAEFDRYGEASERLAKIGTGQVKRVEGQLYYTGPFGVADTSRPFEVAS